MPQPIATWNPARDVWETNQGCLCGHLLVYSETLPTSGMTRAGTAYALPTSAPHMDGSESSSLLGTPRTVLWKAGSMETTRGQVKRNGYKARLEEDISLLPTPTSSDTNGAGPHGDGGRDLRTEVSLMPTPSVADSLGGHLTRGGDRSDELLLAGVAKELSLLPTPAVNDMGAGKTPQAWDEWTAKMKAAHGNGNGHGPSLSIEALRLLPTPSVADGLGGHRSRSGDRSAELLLPGVAVQLATSSTGDSTPPLSIVGNKSPGDPRAPQLSMDEPDPD